MASVSVFRGFLHVPHQIQLPVTRIFISSKKLDYRSNSNGLRLYARYSDSQSAQTQAQDLFTSRLQDSIENLPKLVEDIVQTSINTGPRGALRLAQGVQAVIGVGSEWLTEFSQSRNSPNGMPSQLQLGLVSPLYLRKLFERLGATYIKLGQFIASAPTLFPPEYVQEFQYCFDRAPAVPFDEIKSIIREELAGPIDSIYEYIDPTPLASASIAQVHAARLKGSQADVVIKVLKPGIEDVLVADLNFIYVVARIVEFLNPELSRASLVAIVNDIRASMLEEVDFKKEAANIEAFRGYLESMGLTRQATAPRVYRECSTKKVLTMERLYGVPLTDLDSISSLVSSPETSLITALNVWFGSLLACESFHADVHAGNLWLLRDGRIGFLDFGIVGRISPKQNGTHNTASKGAHVDIVCTFDGNPVWIIVSDRNPKYLSWDGQQESSKNKGLRARAELLLEVAHNSIALKPTSLIFFFSNGLNRFTREKFRSEFGAVDVGSKFSNFDINFSKELGGEWVDILARSYQDASVLEIKVDCPHDVSKESLVARPLVKSDDAYFAGSFGDLMSQIILSYNGKIHGDLINFDTTALIAIVSGISNGNTQKLLATPKDELKMRFKGNTEFVIGQVMSEIENPIHINIGKVISGRKCIVCESVSSEFKELVLMCGGVNEKLRADQLLKRLVVVSDSPSERMMSLPTTRKLALKNKIVFGTGDYWHTPTLTANMGFVRAVLQTGMSLFTFEHKPRALTGD